MSSKRRWLLAARWVLMGWVLWAMPSKAQTEEVADSASRVIDRYVAMTSFSHMAADSMVVVETLITSPQSSDTLKMKRWFAQPQMQRVEVWHDGQLETALCTNGNNRYREYEPKLGYWVDLTADKFYERLSGYDLKGPLHSWRAKGYRLTYKGSVKAKEGLWLTSVKVEAPGYYTRDYLFEPSGLLALILESNEMMDSSDYHRTPGTHIEWKMIHEYEYVGSLLMPRLESFMREGSLTVLSSTAHIEPRVSLLFNQD